MKRLLSLTLAFTLIACSKTADKLAVDGSPFVGSDYSITIPDGWQAKENFMGSDLTLMNPKSADGEGLPETISIVLENIPESMTDEEYLESTTTMMTKAMGADFLETEARKLNGHDATRMRYTFAMGENTFDNDIYLITSDHAAYIITLGAKAGPGRDERIAKLLTTAETFKVL